MAEILVFVPACAMSPDDQGFTGLSGLPKALSDSM